MQSRKMVVEVRFRPRVLAERLARRNISFRQFSRMSRMDSSYISKLLSGERSPSPETREKILRGCRKLGEPILEFDDLFTIENEVDHASYDTATVGCSEVEVRNEERFTDADRASTVSP